MIGAELPNAVAGLAEGWSGFMTQALLDGTLVFVLAAIVWLPLRGRAPAQLGYGLFLLVLLKLALPLQVPVPSWLAALSPSHLLQTLLSGPAPSAALPVATAGAVPAGPVVQPTMSAFGLEAWLLLAWTAVVTVLLARFSWLQVHTARLVTRARRPRAGELGVDLDDLHRRMGLRRRVAVRITERVASPAAGGLLFPYVLLPEGFLQRTSGEPLRWVLLHELAHIRRRDAWVSLLQRLLQIAFFFHPAVWLANRILDEQRELACDDAALAASGGSRRACGEGFLSVVEWAQATRSVPVAALGAFRSQHLTRRRLMRILDNNRRPGSRSAVLSGLFVAALGLLLVPNLTAQESQGEIEQRIKQQEIAILEARLEKLRLESELLQLQLQRLQGGETRGEGTRRRFGGAIGRGRGAGGGLGGARGGSGRAFSGAVPPAAPEAPALPRRGRIGIGAPTPDAPEAPALPRRARAGIGVPTPDAPQAAPTPRRRIGGVRPFGGRGNAPPAGEPERSRARRGRVQREPRAPRPPRGRRGIRNPLQIEPQAPEPPEPPASEARPDRRRAVYEIAPGDVLFEVDEVPAKGTTLFEVEEAPEPDVLFEVVEEPGEVLEPEPAVEVFEVIELPAGGKAVLFEVVEEKPRETETKPEPKAVAPKASRRKVN